MPGKCLSSSSRRGWACCFSAQKGGGGPLGSGSMTRASQVKLLLPKFHRNRTRKYNNTALFGGGCWVSLTGRFHRHSAAGWAGCTVAGPGRVRRHAAQFSERSSTPLMGHARLALSGVSRSNLLQLHVNNSPEELNACAHSGHLHQCGFLLALSTSWPITCFDSYKSVDRDGVESGALWAL